MTTRRTVEAPMIYLIVVVMTWLGAAAPANATTLRRMGLPEIVSRADRVVHARAIDQQVHWDETGRRIYTDTVFQVIEDIKGRGPDQITVSLLGGRISPIVMIVEGTPNFRIGDEVVLFISARPDGKHNLVGFSQGLMRVIEDSGGRKTVAANAMPRGVELPVFAGESATAARPMQQRVPLDQVLDRLQLLVERQADESTFAIGPLNRLVDDASGGRP